MSKVVPIFGTKEDFQPKKTLGQQILDRDSKYAGQFTQTVRETTDEMGKSYMDSLNKCIDMHAHLTTPYYIYEILRPNSHLEGVMECKHIARLTYPLPEWGTGLYKVDNRKGDWIYLWGLPQREEAARFLEDIDGTSKKVITDIQRFQTYLRALPILLPNEEIIAIQSSDIKRAEAADKLVNYWKSLFEFEGA